MHVLVLNDQPHQKNNIRRAKIIDKIS